jgi:hypothetical protein
LGVTHSPTPTTSPSTSAATPVVLMAHGAVWVSHGAAGTFVLDQHGSARPEIRGVTAQPGAYAGQVRVPAPADYVSTGRTVVWVSGGAESGPGRITAVDPQTGAVTSTTLPGEVPTFGTTDDDAFYDVLSTTAGEVVRRFELVAGQIHVSTPLSIPGASQIVATSSHDVWVRDDTRRQLVRLAPNAGGLLVVVQRVSWHGSLLGPVGASVWSFLYPVLYCLDARHVDASPSLSEGCRLTIQGDPGSLVDDGEFGTFVAITGLSHGDGRIGIAYWSKHDMAADSSNAWKPTAFLAGTQVIDMSADPVAGLDYVTPSGGLMFWDPTGH